MGGGQYRWLIIFVLLCMGIIFFSLRVRSSFAVQAVSDSVEEDRGSGRHQDYFKNIQYYYFLWGGREKYFHLSADELLNNASTRKVVFINPEGTISLKEDRTLYYRGERGHFEADREELHLKDKVYFLEGDSKVTCSQALYSTKEKELHLKGNVFGLTRFREHESSVRIVSREALAQPLLGKIRYFGNVEGNIESPRDQGEKLFFASEALDVDLYRHRLDISEGVTFKRDRFEAQGNRGEIFWNLKSKHIEHYILYDNVRLNEKVKRKNEDGFYNRSAFAEKMEGAFDDNRIVLTGRPRVIQWEDVIKGNQIILKKDSDIVEVKDASANFRLRK